jgi:uncharacterized membrane protein (DUF4010 family)
MVSAMELLILKLGLALAIGLLVGLERGWREREAPAGSRTAGIRTYGISGLLGGVFAALAQAFNDASVLLAGFLGFALAFAWFKSREAEHDDDFSVTSVIAALSVFALGGLAVAGDYRAASAGGAGLAAVLASREVLHRLLRRMSWIELRAALMLAVMTAIGLPLLPDHPIDPWGGFNPREVWLFTVLVAAISYLGYIAVKMLGSAKGLLVSGLAGALVSSTAVTVAFGRTAKAGGNARPLSGAASLAAMVSVLRVMTVVLVIQPRVIGIAGPAALAAAAAFAASGLLLIARSKGEDVADVPTRSPFDLVPLLIFAALFAIVSTASAALVGLLGSGSVVATSALSGTFDVDVAVLSALRMVGQAVSPEIAGQAVLAALAANAVGRLALAVSASPIAYWMPLLAATALAAGCGFAAYTLIPAV